MSAPNVFYIRLAVTTVVLFVKRNEDVFENLFLAQASAGAFPQ